MDFPFPAFFMQIIAIGGYMESLALVKRLVEFDNWCNLQTLASLNAVMEVDRKPLDIMVHIYSSANWLIDIIEGKQEKDNSIWQEGMAFDECVNHAETLTRRYEKYLDKLTEEELNRRIGIPGEQTRIVCVRDILMHLVIHSPHHRGQVVSAVRAAGMTPGVPSYISYALRKE